MKRTLLIVDGQAMNRRVLENMLDDIYSFLEASDGKEALDILHRDMSRISAVLLDILTPIADDYIMLRAMSADPALSKIPVIVMSQKDDEDEEVRALSLGAQDFIPKPYKRDILRQRLGNIIRLRETAAAINRIEKDELTGLYNKHSFYENVSVMLAQYPERRFDLLCFGVDRFQLICDTYGQAKGDELLCYIADFLIGHTDLSLLCGRFESGEFYVLLPHLENYEQETFGQWIGAINRFPIDMDVRMYCGIYEISDPTLTVSTMCSRALLAAQKNRGMYDQYYSLYDDSIRQKLLEEQLITSNMLSALAQHQFVVYYQPKYDLMNEYVAGAEALVRWNHPERGLMLPNVFIPLFEKNGFIMQLDYYVWETVCRDMREWLDQGMPPVSVSVNVSRADVYNPRLVDSLLSLVAKYKIPVKYLHLEITESAYTTNPDQIVVVVNRLRELGFIVEMDDFGSGYSSLNMLAKMPVDVLKLDMKFIQQETGRTTERGVLGFVISLAKWLDLAVVAEGVETEEQIAILRSMDCNYVQGFYYAQPMKKTDFDALLRTSKITEMLCTGTAPVSSSPRRMPRAGSSPARVMLIVDDIPLNRATLAAMFDGEFGIVEKANGSEAWDYLQENYRQVDIVLLDLLMPVMDGFRLLSRIRADENMNAMPVIVTSQGSVDSEERALKMQADDFIARPYNADIIKYRVYNVLAAARLRAIYHKQSTDGPESPVTPQQRNQAVFETIERLKPHFDIVRLVDAEHTMVHSEGDVHGCSIHGCFSVWGKVTRCNNCISLEALKQHTRRCKLEYSANGLYFVIAEYVDYDKNGAVIEMVTKLPDEYVDNILDKNLLYINMDSFNRQLEIDELTGVFNRRYIDQYLDDYVSTARQNGQDMGIAMIDVDRFKKLNDTCGHLTGDRVLKDIGGILRENIAYGSGDFAARYGGDEFLVVCRNVSAAEFQKRLHAISQIIRHITVEKLPEGTSISVGCVTLGEFSAHSANELIDEADKRLYQAKARRT